MGIASNSVDERFDPRHNSVNALRLFLAGLVLLSHSLKLHGGVDPLEPITRGGPDMGTIAVDGFFALSGYLITQSYLNSPSVGRYLWRRALRILPGFWVCLIVTTVIVLPAAQLLTYGSMAGFPLTGEQSATSYLLGNAGLYIQQYEVRGLFGGESVNGSLYTLFCEFLCYVALIGLGLTGLLTRRRRLVLAAAGLAWAALVADLLSGGALTGDSYVREVAIRLAPMFLAGVIVRLWSHRIRLTVPGGLIALAALTAGVVAAGFAPFPFGSTLIYMLVAPPAVAYLVLLAGARTELASVGAKRDLSYGLYIYAWPVQVLLLVLGATGWPLPAYFAASLAAALTLALASWTFVEAPALALKSWSPSPRRRSFGSPSDTVVAETDPLPPQRVPATTNVGSTPDARPPRPAPGKGPLHRGLGT